MEGVTEDGVEGQLVEEADIDTVNLDESVGADTPAPEAKVKQNLMKSQSRQGSCSHFRILGVS